MLRQVRGAKEGWAVECCVVPPRTSIELELLAREEDTMSDVTLAAVRPLNRHPAALPNLFAALDFRQNEPNRRSLLGLGTLECTNFTMSPESIFWSIAASQAQDRATEYESGQDACGEPRPILSFFSTN